MRVLVSILNWNKAQQTINCIRSLASERSSAELSVLVIDNGSRPEDVACLEKVKDTEAFLLQSLPENLGFTGGHNIAMEIALREKYDFIWLLNNDALIVPGALQHLLAAMSSDMQCGAASPVIIDIKDHESVVSCINTHDWSKRTCDRHNSISQARRIQNERPEEVWLLGTGIFFRVRALEEVGMLDNRLFAYYDDDDIGSRLAAAGWTSKCVFDASIVHETREKKEQALYYYYLMQRNEMLFWHKNTPDRYRRLLWLKLMDSALFYVNRLYRQGFNEQGDAALMGIYDFIFRRFGAPVLGRKPPVLMRMVCRLCAWLNRAKFNQADLVPQKPLP